MNDCFSDYLLNSGKVGVWIGNLKNDPQVGGGFTFLDSILSELQKLMDPPFEIIVFYTGKTKVRDSKRVKWVRINQSFTRRVLVKIDRLLVTLNLPTYFWSELELSCIDNRVSLLWIAFPDFVNLKKIPYVYTLWDLGHKTTPFFPEVSICGEYERRDSMYRFMLSRAMRIIIGNSKGREEIIRHFNIERNLIKEIPFAVSKFNEPQSEIKALSALSEPFIFYPAQFWPHKNHMTALKTIKWLKEECNINLHLVLTGSDKGNMDYIKFAANKLQIEKNVHFIGFVQKSELIWLYKNAIAMTFFSAMGPNNIPPLEALSLSCPLVVSDIPGHREQLGDKALYAAVFDHRDWASKLQGIILSEGQKSSPPDDLAVLTTYEKYIESVVDLLKECLVIRDLWP